VDLQLTSTVDLVSGDGLHSLVADLNALPWGLVHTHGMGWLVIEEISKDPRSLQGWAAMDALLSNARQKQQLGERASWFRCRYGRRTSRAS